jgi:hypothetical protein
MEMHYYLNTCDWREKTGMTTVWQLEIIHYLSNSGKCLLNFSSLEENAKNSARPSTRSLSSTHQIYRVFLSNKISLPGLHEKVDLATNKLCFTYNFNLGITKSFKSENKQGFFSSVKLFSSDCSSLLNSFCNDLVKQI